MLKIKVEPIKIQDIEKHTPLLEVCRVYDYSMYIAVKDFNWTLIRELLNNVSEMGVRIEFNN